MKKLFVISILLGATYSQAWAESDAISFAIQAGAIAGAAQACGQDPMLLGSRVAEAIILLAKDDEDRNQASTSYQHALQEASHNEAATQKIGCNQVLQDYNSLPILKSDYKQTVLAPMLAPPASNAANPNLATANNNSPNLSPGAALVTNQGVPANNNDAAILPSQQPTGSNPSQNHIQTEPSLPDMSHSGAGISAPTLPGNYVPNGRADNSQQNLVLQNNPAYQPSPATLNSQVPISLPSSSSGGPAY